MVRKLVICTGSRADYGVLKPLLRLARDSAVFELQLIVAGMHLSEKHGNTRGEIQADGQKIKYQVSMEPYCDWDTGYQPVERISKGLMGFVNAYAALKPDLVMVEGDRIEALAAALAAAYMGIPILHDGGGVLTRTIDNAARHAISHFASLHTVELPEARERLIRFGCDPATIHVVGALGIDAIRQMEWRSRAETLADLGLPPDSRYLLVTFHPESEYPEMAGEWMEELLKAAGECGDIVITYPNSDPGSAAIIAEIERFAGAFRATVKAFPSLGSTRYLHAMKHAEALVGNSSSGLLEAPTLRVPVVNVGSRQYGRPMARNVWSCRHDVDSIRRALGQVLAPGFRAGLADLVSPYGDGYAAERILAVVERRLGE